jgi:gliding motility-associated-like protein
VKASAHQPGRYTRKADFFVFCDFVRKYSSIHTRTLTILPFSLLIIGSVFAQQGNKWYFGRGAGVEFVYSGTIPLTNGVINTFEGSASVCNEDGELLFYTDGITVYNRLHKPMPNGQGLKGNLSTYQSCIIVPKPGYPNIYYIFTADAVENDGAAGYNYSEVNMNLENGLGNVTNIKNLFLYGPSSERLTAVMAANYVDYWVLTNDRNSNTFRAFRITCNGVDTDPIVSQSGKVVNESNFANIGALKVSADGRWIAQTNNHGSRLQNPVNEYAQLFRFNNNTGVVSDGISIDLSGEGYYFGCEFSSGSRFLYFTNPRTNAIHQYDLSSGNAATILSTNVIFPMTSGSVAAMQLGPDQKIYIATNISQLHVIENPDSPGAACNPLENAADLAGRISILGLTSYIPNYFSNRPADFTYTILDSCKGEVQFNGVNRVANAIVQWEFGDGTTSTTMNPVHTFPSSGDIYRVKIRLLTDLGCGDYITAKPVLPGGAYLEAKFGMITDCANRSITLRDSTITSLSNLTYTWKFGDGSSSNEREPVHTYAVVGDYTVELVVSSGACAADTFRMQVKYNLPDVNAGPDREVLPGQTTQLRATGAARYEWFPATYLNSTSLANPLSVPFDDITYFVTGFASDGCPATDTVNIKVVKSTIIEVPTAFTPNNDGLNDRLKPLLYGVGELEHFIVFNRWGQKVFETKIIGEGWDGTIQGKLQDSGTYIWILQVRDDFGQTISKKGMSTLIR